MIEYLDDLSTVTSILSFIPLLEEYLWFIEIDTMMNIINNMINMELVSL
jgi:hypothetical protein